MAPPNVLWICTDQQRFDTLGCYGNDLVETSNIDQLAKSGVQFNHAYCQSPVCTPSRASFLTGRYPRTTKVRQNGQAIPESETLVTRQLADNGYFCGLSGKLHTAPADPEHKKKVPKMEKRIDDGYADFHWSHDPREYVHDEYWPSNEYHQWLHERNVEYKQEDVDEAGYVKTSVAPEHYQTTWCAEKAINFIEQNQENEDPWTFSVNIFDPHVPFDPPEEYLEQHIDRLDEIPLPKYQEGELDDKPIFHKFPPSFQRMPFQEIDEEGHRLIRAAYWAMIDLIDDQVGRILNTLEWTGQRDDTIVIFMSDHGEMLGDHGIYLKGTFFYESAIRVPLIISWPDNIESERESNALVELTDVVPTILDAVDIEPDPGIQGKSFWPLLCGDTPLDDHRDDIYSEYYHALERDQFYDELQTKERWLSSDNLNQEFHTQIGTADVAPLYQDMYYENSHALPYATMVRTNRYKLVKCHSVEEGEIYDIKEDPSEFNNLYHNEECYEIKINLLKRLTDKMAETIDPLPPRKGRFQNLL